MNKKKLIIILSVVLVILALLTTFVFKARGSNERELLSGCVPYNVSISKGGQYQAIIEWYTVDECLGYIMYGDDRSNLKFIAIDQNALSPKKHTVQIEKLLPSKNYFALIYSGESSYGNKGIPLCFSLSSL